MRVFLIALVFCLCTSVSFAQSQARVADLYSSYLKGLLHLQNGEFPEALKELKKAQAKDPASIHIPLRIATVLIRMEQYDEAEKVLQEALLLLFEPGDIVVAAQPFDIRVAAYDSRSAAWCIKQDSFDAVAIPPRTQLGCIRTL